MKTDRLIAALACDAGTAGPALGRRLTLALALGAILALALMLAALGPRPDLAAASRSLLFGLKLALAGTLAVAAAALLRAAARPEAALPRIVLLVPALLFLFALGHEIATQPQGALTGRLVGNNWRLCLLAIPLIGALPLAAILAAMAGSAPRSATLAGALAGLAAGALAALAYGLHCGDDSPLFIAAWYAPGIGALALAGALAGRRLLAW